MKKRKQFFRFVLAYNIVLLIPLIIISLSIVWLYQNQQKLSLQQEAQTRLARQASIWGQQLSVIRQFNKHCKYDKKYNEGYSERPSVFFDVSEELKQLKQNNPFIDGVYVYVPSQKMVITSNGISYPEVFFEKICQLAGEDREALLREQEDAGPIKAYPARINLEDGEGMVVVSPIRTWSDSAASQTLILYTLRYEQLKLQFGDAAEGRSTVLRQGAKVLFASGSPESSEEAWPELISNQNPVRYYHFEQAFGEGFRGDYFVSKAYLFKDVLNNIKGYALWFVSSLLIGFALALYFSRNRYRSFQKLILNNAELEEEKNELSRLSCFYELFLKEIDAGDSLWQACLENGIQLQRRYKLLFMLPSKLLHDVDFEKHLQERTTFEDGQNVYSVELIRGMCIVLLCADRYPEALKTLLEERAQSGHNIGIGPVFEPISELRQAYEAARAQCNAKSVIEHRYPEAAVQSLQEAVSENNPAKARVLLQELLAYTQVVDEKTVTGIVWDLARIFELDAGQITAEWREKNISIKRLAVQIMTEENTRLQEQIKRQQQSQRAAAKVISADYTKRSIAEIIDYIQACYLDENFSAKQLAAHFDTSVSNISHFFKKNIGITISQYVIKIKLEKAKDLLRNSDKRISEIAQLLGYSNGTAFIEMFKKYEGMTPGVYRASVGGCCQD